jgi:DNA (cytosine-5)-methyltransferase 1
MRYLSVCSGIEAASVAWHSLGWTPVGFAEIEPFPCEVLKQRFPNVPNYGDLTNYEQWPIEPGTVDVLVGGPPCQAFSVAGLREGMADPRGNLSLLYFGLVKRIKPKWIVYENVPGLLSARSGSDFSSLLSALAECGYGFAYRMLDAQHFSLAQRRQRIFIVGCRTGDWRHSTAVLFDGPSSFGHFKKGEEPWEETPPASGTGAGSPSRINCQPNGISGTVTNKWHKGSGGPAGDEHYNLVVRGVSNSHWDGSDVHPTLNQSNSGNGSPGYSNQELFAQGGSGLVPALPIAFKVRCGGEYTGAKGGDVKPNERGGTGMLHYEDKTFTVAATQDQFVATPVIAPTITTCKGSKGGSSSEAIDEIIAIHHAQQVIPINTMAATRPQGADENRQTFGVGQPGDTTYTITAHHHHAVGVQPHQVIYENHPQDSRVTGPHEISPAITAKFGTGGGNVPFVQNVSAVAFQPGNLVRRAGSDPSTEVFPTLSKDSGDQNPHVAVPMAVRRLLPSECEALQGFPKDWTKISWRGKPVDECPDGPRYKAIGNSMATNCMHWIGRRIQLVDDLVATLPPQG